MPRRARLPQPKLPAAILAAAHATAQARGQTIEAYLASLVEANAGQPTAADLANLIAAAPLIGADTNEC